MKDSKDLKRSPIAKDNKDLKRYPIARPVGHDDALAPIEAAIRASANDAASGNASLASSGSWTSPYSLASSERVRPMAERSA